MTQLPNILIVDDLEGNLLLLENILKANQANLITAFSGKEALEKIRDLELAVAIIDIHMPEMNGFELAIKMNENRKEEMVPIIFLTASYGNESQVLEGYKVGAVDYIIKPINNHILQSKIKVFIDLHNQKHAISENAKLLKRTADELFRVNSALKISEEKYRSYIENAPDGVFVADKNGKYLEVNEAACLITGYSKEELLTMSISDILPKDAIEDGLEHFSKLINKDRAKSDLPFKHKNNSIRWWTLTAVKLSENKFIGFAKDITKRKLVEDDLKQATLRLELATRTGGIGVWDLDMEKNYFIWDEQMFKLYGVDKHNFGYSYEDWQACIHLEDRERTEAEVVMAIRGERDFDTEFRTSWPDGSVHYLKASAIVLRDKSGKPIRSIGINWDITKQKQLEEKLKSSETNFRTFFESMNDMIFVGSTNGDLIYLNDAVSRNLGYKKGELEGKHVLDLHPANLRSEAEKIFSEMFAGKRNSCPLPIQKNDGSLLPVETRVWFGKWDGNDCIFGFSKDLSAEQEALQKFNKIFANNPAIMAITTIPGEVFTDINDTFLEKIGYSKEEVIGKTADELGLFIRPEEQKKGAVDLAQKGKLNNLPLKVKTRSGEILDGLFSGEIIESQGKKYFLTVMVDITDLRQAEEEIHRVNRFLDSIIENIPNMIFLKDALSLKFVRFNQAGEKLLGISKEELLGKNDYDFFPREQAKSFMEKDKEVLRNRISLDISEEIIQTRNEGTRVLNTKKVSILNDIGEPEYLLGISEDITERKMAEEILKKSESNLAEAQRMAKIGSWDWDVFSNTVKWSKEMFRIFDVNPSEFDENPETLVKLLPPDNMEVFTKSMTTIFSSDNSTLPEYRIIQKNGSVRYIYVTGKNFHDKNGKLIKCLGTVQDITERRLTDEALRKSEELFRSVVNNSLDLTALTNLKGIISFLSPQCESVLGYPDSFFLGKKVSEIVHLEDKERYGIAWEKMILEGKDLKEFEYRIIDGQGLTRWISQSATQVRVNKKVIGIQSTLRNITERKIVEQALIVSEEKYKTMLNASPDGIFLINMKGIITEASEIGLELLGADNRDDLVGRNFYRFIPADEKNVIREIIEKTMNEGLAQNIGLKIRKKTKILFAAETSVTLIQDVAGMALAYMIIIRDISQRKKMEANQIHTDRMSTLGEMASGIAHEINQPLNIISMVMDKILFEATKSETIDLQFLKKKSNIIFENITRMKNIIDHIRAFSRNQDDYVSTTFSLNSSIGNATSMVSEQFKHLGIALKLQLDKQIPQIVGNTYKFEQVILNLLSNAKDAVVEKKSKLPETFEMIIEILSYQDTSQLIVEVCDNGIGIGDEDINNIMLPFYTTKEEGKGTGLGLSICYQIIREMGGTIEIMSNCNTGTKIKLVFDNQKKK